MSVEHATIVSAGWAPAKDFGQVQAHAEHLDALLKQLSQLEWEQAATAAILELVVRIEGADNIQAASRAAVEGIKHFLNCDQVAIGLTSNSGFVRLTVLSDVVEIDRSAELTRQIEAALDEPARGGSLTAWSADDEHNSSLAHRRLSPLLGSRPLLSTGLKDRTGAPVGAVLIAGEAATTELARRFMSAVAEPLGTALRAKMQLNVPGALRWVRHLRAKRSWLTTRTCLAITGGIVGIALLPVHYKVSCPCELQPTVRRFVAAPYEGIFEKSLVKPGDIVKREQVLALMDDRELRLEQAALEAEQERARKSRDVNTVGGKIAAAQIDALEVERLKLKQKLLSERAQHLEIRSPLDGLVIGGDLERSQGVPVKVGQPLYEVAPLDQMLIEVEIPEDQIAYVQPGQSVQVRLDAHSGRAWEGKLAKVHPRSELREHDNVFIGEIFIANAQQQLRPGMKGHVKIVTARHTLIWIVLHRPWHRIASFFGW